MIDSDHQPDPLLTIRDYPGHTPGSIIAFVNTSDGRRYVGAALEAGANACPVGRPWPITRWSP